MIIGRLLHLLTVLRRRRVPLDSWWLDVKLGGRMLVKYPGLALAGGAGIAVAVAIAAAAFSLIHDNYLAATLPLEEGDRIVAVELWDLAANKPDSRILRDYLVWREELKSIQDLGVFTILTPNLITPGARPESIRVASMSAAGFRVARVRPLLGRHLEEQDESPGAPPVAVIGEDVWRNRFGSDPSIAGRVMQLGSTAYTIVGVMPKGFAFPIHDQVWTPLRRAGVAPPEPLTGPSLMVFGRLAPGATIESAQAELTAIGQRTMQEFPRLYDSLRPRVLAYPRPFAGIHGSADVAGLLTMQGILFSLLVLVCLNVTILVYTRTALRQAEIGVRTALGASRGRIVAQLFIEALVLSAVAAVAGIAIAAVSVHWISEVTAHLASTLPFWLTFRLSPESILYAAALSVIAAAIVGIAPAWQATRRSVHSGLRIAGNEGMRLGKTWTVLIVVQVGFAVALLPPAVSSAWKETQDGLAGLGFAAEEFLSAQMGLDPIPGSTVAPTPGTPEFARHFGRQQTELMRRLQADTRVSGVTFSMAQPGDEPAVRIEAQQHNSENEVHEVRINRVGVDFFRTFDVPLLAGRGFTMADSESDGGVVIVNLPFAQKVFGGHALGQRFRYADAGSRDAAAPYVRSGRWYEIVGVVADFPTGVSQGMRDNPHRVYHAIAPGQVQPASIAIRMRGGSGAVTAGFGPRLREIAATVDPDLQLRDVRGLDEALRSEQWISRLTAAAFILVTLSVLLLSSAGVYALMSFTVSQRRKEVGIRMALGADWTQIVTSIFSRAFAQIGTGALLGAVLGLSLEQASGGVLMRGNAAIVVPAVSLGILIVGFLAALGPTRRSLRIDPTEALREQ